MSSEKDLSCVLCDESFDNKEELQLHFRKHGDPTFNKNIINKSSPSTELPKQGKNSSEVELVSCEVCSETFTAISKAITHKHKVHPDHDAKYFCPWCGKLFTMKHLYNKHIESSHGDKKATEMVFHCDECDVDFFIPSAMLYHNKYCHRQDPEAITIGQSTKLKSILQEFIQVSYCPFCGEEYINKVNLHKHLFDEHSEENQSPDEVLRCPLCDAIFYHLDAYELHLTFHSTEDMYTDKNELAEKVTEFSLESVSPIKEKVNCETEAFETAGNFIEVESFLQQAMNESMDNNDNSNSELSGKKHKKHKKHKKSKSKNKEAITLDEFLSMNSDVFGEGIDFQGIEEVPTKAVTKRLQKRPVKAKTNSGTASELQKLKKLGIAVKKKAGIHKLQGVKIASGKPVSKQNHLQEKQYDLLKKAKQQIEQAKSTPINTSIDVLSKLMNQSNSQLKIVKKSAVENITPKDTENSEMNMELQSPPAETSGPAEDGNDHFQDSKANSHASAEENITKKQERENSVHADKKSLPEEGKKDTNIDNESNYLQQNDELNSLNAICYKKSMDCDDEEPTTDIKSPNHHEHKGEDTVPNTDALRNLTRNCTIKSIPATKNITSPIITEKINNKSNANGIADAQLINNESNKKIETEFKNKPLVTNSNVLHNISQHLTIKSIPKAMQDTDKQSNIKEQEDIKPVVPDNNSNPTDGIKLKPPKTSNVVHNLSPHLTIKSVQIVKSPNVTSTEKQNRSDHLEDDHDEELNQNNKEANKTSLKQDIRNTASDNSSNVLHNLSQHLTIKPVSKTLNDSQASKVQTKENDDLSHCDLGDEGDKVAETKSSNPLIRLSSLITVKPVNKVENTELEKKKVLADSSETEFDESEDLEHDNDLIAKESSTKTQSIGALKGLNKNITIKSSPTKTDSQNSKNCSSKNPGEANKIALKPMNSKTQKLLSATSTKQANLPNTSNSTYLQGSSSTQIQPYATAILKNLPNVTAKSITKCSQQTITKSTVQSTTKKNFVQKTVHKKERVESEVFNIEDSDEEEANSQDSSISNRNVTQAKQYVSNTSKHLTIKPAYHNKNQSPGKNPNQINPNVNQYKVEPEDDVDDDSWPDDNDIINSLKSRKIQNATSQVKNLLHMTVKNMGTNVATKSNPNSTKNKPHVKSKMLDGFDTDSDNSNQGVKITEMNSDDNFSDDDTPLNQLASNKQPKNSLVESPHESNSESEALDHDDIEANIKTNLVSKSVNRDKPPVDKNYPCLKNLGKNITIKSNLKERENCGEENDVHSEDDLPQNESANVPNFGANVTVKSLKPIINKPMPLSKKTKLMNDHTVSKQTSNMSSSQVNKEVTVQTFQTKTVVQEITTTVTKTIRTVNQSMKQESRNICQINSPKVRPQKIQGQYPQQGQSTMYHQGIPVRPPGPSVVGSKIRQETPAKQQSVEHTSSQLIPVRPRSNVIRPNKTQASSTRINAPSTSGFPHTGKLKIAPNALVPMLKRPIPEEPSGPFSCFKKPKESLIPDSDDFPPISLGGDSAYFGSSSHMSKSNVTTTSKVVKGNSVVTSTQVKSQMSASAQQIGKLNNLSGLKISKTSQIKQPVERNNDSGPKKTTLEGIEKLQRLGLLVKKPRFDFDANTSEHSDDEDVDT